MSINETVKISGIGRWIASPDAKFGREPLKRLFLLACLVVLMAPYSAFAGHHHIRADEMAGIGVGAAALVGAVGYLLLRRRHMS